MLGAHSIRKGDITIVAIGYTVSPPIASICLRAGWSMGPIKDRYTHYEKAGDQFVGWSVTVISSSRKTFGMSPVHAYWTESPSNLKYRMETLIEDNLVRRTGVSSPTFEHLKYLFFFICFHCEYLDAHLNKIHRLRASPIYIAPVREKDLHKYDVIRYPWFSTNDSPYATGIPLHFILMAEIEALKAEFEKQTTHIVEDIRTELNARNVGGDLYKVRCVLG